MTKCKAHPTYQAMLKPRSACVDCWNIYSDRAIAKARREGRIEGWHSCNNAWADSEGYVRITRQDAAKAVDAKWPEDKP